MGSRISKSDDESCYKTQLKTLMKKNWIYLILIDYK